MNLQSIRSIPPSPFTPHVEIAACVCVYANTILLLEQAPHKDYAHKWGIPGGKKGKGESIEEAVIRETQEETGIVLQEPRFIHTFYCRYGKKGKAKDFTFYLFHTIFQKEPLVSLSEEHLFAKWVEIDSLKEVDLLPGTRDCLSLLKMI